MQLCGIICEFNPFHNGHEYLIKQAKKLTDSKIVCLMSGNFVQRGDPAFQEKYERAKNAISCGADVVLELPTIYAVSNAENFAYGSIKTFKALNTKYLAFGIENTELEILQKIANIKFQNSISFQNSFKNEIENGINYNTALKRAIAKELNYENITEILNKPNNILAIEYLTAIKKLDAKITPIAIKRIDNGYNSNIALNSYLSASGIREIILDGGNASKFIPAETNLENYFNLSYNQIFETISILTIRNNEPKELEKYYDYNEGIEYRIKKFANQSATLDELTSLVATPRYRVSRVKKLLLYPLLGITKQVEILAKKSKAVAKVLAIKKSCKEFLSLAPKQKICLIATNKDYDSLPSNCKKIIDIDLLASNLYNTVIQKQNNNDKKTGVLFL